MNRLTKQVEGRGKNSRKKVIVIIGGGALLLTLVAIGGYVFAQMGRITPSAQRDSAFGHKPYYCTDTHQFISSEPISFHPERITGGSISFARFLVKSKNAPQGDIPKVALTRESFAATPAAWALHWLGHSSAILEIDGQRIAVDPVLDNAAPFPGIVSRYTSSPIERSQLPNLDAVLITHDHYDHLEARTIRALNDTETRFIVPLGLGARLQDWGVDAGQISEVGWDETINLGTVQITACPTVHYSGRSGKDRNMTLWAAYAIRGSEKSIFWSGDTGYSSHFADIGQKYGPFDLACIEIDGWNDGWPNTHLFPDEAVTATKDVRAKALMPIHWGVFDLAMHPWRESIEKVCESAVIQNVELITPLMGQRIIPGQTPTNDWWR